MLRLWRHPHTNELRLYIRGVSTQAWISPSKPDGHREPSVRHGRDWVLWVRSGQGLTLENCPARLEVQSLLRAWLIQRYGRPLFTMTFAQLCRLAAKQGATSYVRRGLLS